jgi:transcriptional regulator with XRE-family HTH domain
MKEQPNKHTLRILRERLGMNREELAKLIDRSPLTVRAIEQGKLPLSLGVAAKLSAATGIGIEWLTDNDPNQPPVDKRGNPYDPALAGRLQDKIFAQANGMAPGELSQLVSFSLYAKLQPVLARMLKKRSGSVVALVNRFGDLIQDAADEAGIPQKEAPDPNIPTEETLSRIGRELYQCQALVRDRGSGSSSSAG